MNAIPAPNATPSVKGSNDSTMEDILASIRRIIADDQVLPLAPRPPRPTLVNPPLRPLRRVPDPVEETPKAEAGPGASEWIEDVAPALRPSLVEEPAIPPPPRVRRVVEQPQAAEPQAAEPKTAEPAAPVAPPAVAAAPLLSDQVKTSVASSFQSLAETMLLRDSDTMERMTREMLRPMLQHWLDENLPTLVERLVRVEIERVARGGR